MISAPARPRATTLHAFMPIYEYRCANDHVFEVSRSMSDDPLTECEECGAPVERVFHPVAVHYKGSGFYATDYAKKSAAAKPGSDSSGDDKKSESSEKKPDSGGSKSDSSKKSDSGSSTGG